MKTSSPPADSSLPDALLDFIAASRQASSSPDPRAFTVPAESEPATVPHAAHHRVLQQAAQALMRHYRERFMISPLWQIKLEVCCPERMPEGVQGSASWGYLPNRQYVMRLRCDLSARALDWVIPHELTEMMAAHYGEFCLELIETYVTEPALKERLHREHGDLRNELIEHVLRIMLDRTRPFEEEDEEEAGWGS